MRAHTLPAAAGWTWITGAMQIYRRNPPLLALLVMVYWFTVLFLNLLPILGTLAASLLIPGLSVGLMRACRNLERGEAVGLQTLFGSLKENPRSLMLLGLIYLLATLTILSSSALVDGGDFLSFMLSAKPVDPDTLESSDFLLPILFVMTLLTPLLMAYWYAPVLAAWHGLKPGKALFFSFVACWMNWRPFLVYTLGLLLVAGIFPGLLIALLTTLMPQLQKSMSLLITVPMVLMVAPTIFASFYVSYRDVFGISERA